MLLRKNIPLSYTFGKIKYEVLFIFCYSIFVWIMYHNFHFVRIAIPLSVPAIMGTVISLLLGFRSNQAYDRWWEARHIWGAIVNESRTLGRQVICFVGNDYADSEKQQFRSRIINRQIAWVFSLGQHLRDQDAMDGMEKWLDNDDIKALAYYTNKPAAILNLHAHDVNAALELGYLNNYQQIELDRTITRLCDAQGKCERIKNTVFPSTYSMYIHFSLLLFIGLLPFGLIDFFGIAEILVVTAISSSFLLIEKMSIHLQDPFDNKPTDTPVTNIAGNIDRDLKQMLRERITPKYITESEAEQEDVFFVM